MLGSDGCCAGRCRDIIQENQKWEWNLWNLVASSGALEEAAAPGLRMTLSGRLSPQISSSSWVLTPPPSAKAQDAASTGRTHSAQGWSCPVDLQDSGTFLSLGYPPPDDGCSLTCVTGPLGQGLGLPREESLK